MKFGLSLASVAIALAVALTAQISSSQTKTAGIVAMTPGEAADLAAAETALADAQKALETMRQQIIQRAVAAFAEKTPSVPADGCTEARTGVIEAGQVAIRSTRICAEGVRR
jgi:hypothetical protein